MYSEFVQNRLLIKIKTFYIFGRAVILLIEELYTWKAGEHRQTHDGRAGGIW